MEFSEIKKKIIGLLEKNNIAEVARIDIKSLPAFTDSILLDLKYSEARKIPYDTSSYILKVFLFFLGITFSNILYILKRYKFKIQDCSNVKYVFLPFSDLHYIRFKHIPDILSKDYLIIYPPVFHFKALEKHFSYFNRIGIKVYMPKFGFINSFKFLFCALKITFKVRKASKEISSVCSLSAKNSLQSGICMCLIYHLFFNNFISSLSKINNNKIIWFFDFDKDFKYISINSEIKKLRLNDKTVHIQHGIFWGNNIAYTYPNADYIFCCSEREKNIISGTTSDAKRIIIVGAPLQCFDNLNIQNDFPSQILTSKFIVLLSETLESSLLNLQNQILHYLKCSENISYRLRLRPSSKEEDLIRFSDNIDHSKISNNKTLYEDLISSSIVISFSYDALFECFSLNKPVLLGSYDNSDGDLFIKEFDDKFLPIQVFNNSSELKSLIESNSFKSYNSLDNVFIRDNFGEINFAKVRQNYINAINAIEEIL